MNEMTELHAGMCAALADPRRILLLYAISLNTCSVSDLANKLNISQPAASRHLKILRDHGLVQPIRQGNSIEYHISDERIIHALDILCSVLKDRLAYQASLINE